ncbi:MAG: hypothetical protein AUG13_04920 [Chloroflexi bacterium 13_1_20CM_2_59_7]|nr:MAG: hypothetical protein AUG13_04920 [Chloroflexi bacterium 13_1_20CM_2_59_7]
MEINNKRVLVVGLGKSGVASALFLKARGARVTVSDAKPEDELGEEIPILLDHGIAVETGGHGERTFRGQDLIVVSPGVATATAPIAPPRARDPTSPMNTSAGCALYHRKPIADPTIAPQKIVNSPTWGMRCSSK